MPHRIKWIISPVSNLQAEHCLHIELDPRQIKQGLATPPHNLEISLPRGPTFTAFRTVWCNAPAGFPGLLDDWGYDSDPVSGRWYRISYPHVIADMPQWDKRSSIQLQVTTRQAGAWRAVVGATEFALEAVNISPPVDGEICVLAPKPTGWWAHLCESLLSHLNLGAPYVIDGRRIPLHEEADWPIKDEKECRIRFQLSSARHIDIRILRVAYAPSLLYRWLTSRKAIWVGLGVLTIAAYTVYGVIQFVVWLNQVL